MSGNQIVVLILAGLGVLFMLVSAFGIVRLKGVHRRMHAASVGASMGILLLLLSAGIYYASSAQFGRMALLVFFFFFTAPIATTAMARAAYRTQQDRMVRYVRSDDLANPRYVPDYVAHSNGEESSAP